MFKASAAFFIAAAYARVAHNQLIATVAFTKPGSLSCPISDNDRLCERKHSQFPIAFTDYVFYRRSHWQLELASAANDSIWLYQVRMGDYSGVSTIADTIPAALFAAAFSYARLCL
jgi:hypothetical protein